MQKCEEILKTLCLSQAEKKNAIKIFANSELAWSTTEMEVIDISGVHGIDFPWTQSKKCSCRGFREQLILFFKSPKESW